MCGNVRERRVRPIARWLCLALVLLAVALSMAICYHIVHSSATRFYAYGGYANALRYYHEVHGMLPESLDQLEAAYGAYKSRRAQLPPPSPFRRPVFRPIEASGEGQYLILMEPKPSDWLI